MKTICCLCHLVLRDDGKPTRDTHTYCPSCLVNERRKYGLGEPDIEVAQPPPIAHWFMLGLFWLAIAAALIIFGCQPA